MKDCYDQQALIRRLNRVQGQITAIRRMIEDDAAKCEDIMIQINAADSALHSIGLVILEGHLGHCVRRGIEGGNADTAIKNFINSLEQYLGIK